MILAALEMEVEEYRQRYHDAHDVVSYVARNGQARPRCLTVGASTGTLRAPHINGQRRRAGVRQKFTSTILPPYVCRSGNVREVLLGENAAGLSHAAMTRLTTSWWTEYEHWQTRSSADRDFIYV